MHFQLLFSGWWVIGHREVTSALCSSSRTRGIAYSQVRVVTFLFPTCIGLAVQLWQKHRHWAWWMSVCHDFAELNNTYFPWYPSLRISCGKAMALVIYWALAYAGLSALYSRLSPHGYLVLMAGDYHITSAKIYLYILITKCFSFNF